MPDTPDPTQRCTCGLPRSSPVHGNPFGVGHTFVPRGGPRGLTPDLVLLDDPLDAPTCPATLDDDLDPLACHLPARHHSPEHYDRDRRCTWTDAGYRIADDPQPLPNDGPWPGGPGA